MAEGGLLAWKRQTVDEHRGPATSYAGVHRSLPDPPQGMKWAQDASTREWAVVPVNSSHTIAEAVLVPDVAEAEIVVAETKDADEKEADENKINSNNNNVNIDDEDDDDRKKKVHVANDGARFLEHHMDDHDTFQGICLKYRVTAIELRRANCFTGSNLHLAPNPLRIPVNAKNLSMTGKLATAKPPPTKDQLVRNLARSCRGLTGTEARCYLEMNDWDYKVARQNARDDIAQEDGELLSANTPHQDGSNDSSMMVRDLTIGQKASMAQCCFW
mmetsp:Transcript_12877/g.37389  ORF Transcript_12877/g.37389 Transcript_12877/m.37389 type:complete len:273 (+) Transcript_12877:125-943(+)|eukprot:CAMPEP_0119546374 /NCGR_PEP_ID=MMETSP1352-20130426/829_1 /TAXON_ID=265584 /ORGANISM="Stauroneis constricta, Strain CCMP1120" /LENGTH=272 /DNA_ID=CAMNT_0007591077 /DNA_START=111 /DNA_END=929 /DNA_ORIENTATION=-